jgi:hypothetical protein
MTTGSWSMHGNLQMARVAVSSAQLLALAVSPVQLLPSPGAGLAIVILAVTASLEFGTAAYSNDATFGTSSASLVYGTSFSARCGVHRDGKQ